MRSQSWIVWLSALSLGASGLGCVYVNIYFPENEVRDAAEEIVKEVRPDEPSSESTESTQGRARLAPSRGADRLAAFLLPTAHAAPPADEKEKKDDKKFNLDVSTPVIKKIKEALKKRYPELVPFYEKGALGEARTGYLVLKDAAGLSLKEKRDAEALLKADNDDRKNLYKELGRANQIDEANITKIGEIFSAEWQKKAKPGWWIETEKDKWVKKAKPEAKSPKAS